MQGPADTNSIHAKGEKTLEAFRNLQWGGAELTFGPRAGRGAKDRPDCTVKFPDDGLVVPVEIKTCTTATGQMRPVAYQTTALWDGANDWWVIPPDDLVRLARSHNGQHCVSSFECFNAGKPTGWRQWQCQASEVPQRVRRAHEQGQRSPLKAVVDAIKKDVVDLWRKHLKAVQEVIEAEDRERRLR